VSITWLDVQTEKPGKGKRKAEPAEDEDSEVDQLSSEDESVPGKGDPKDSNEFDEDFLGQEKAWDVRHNVMILLCRLGSLQKGRERLPSLQRKKTVRKMI